MIRAFIFAIVKTLFEQTNFYYVKLTLLFERKKLNPSKINAFLLLKYNNFDMSNTLFIFLFHFFFQIKKMLCAIGHRKKCMYIAYQIRWNLLNLTKCDTFTHSYFTTTMIKEFSFISFSVIFLTTAAAAVSVASVMNMHIYTSTHK